MEYPGETYIDPYCHKKKKFSFDRFWERTTDILIVVFALCVALL